MYAVEIHCVDCETLLTHHGNKQEIKEFLDANDHEGTTVIMTLGDKTWRDLDVYEELKDE